MNTTRVQCWLCLGVCGLFAIGNMISGKSPNAFLAAMMVILALMPGDRQHTKSREVKGE